MELVTMSFVQYAWGQRVRKEGRLKEDDPKFSSTIADFCESGFFGAPRSRERERERERERQKT